MVSMEPWLRPREKGIELLLYISPGASKSEVIGLYQRRLKIRITARPENGEANAELLEFLSQKLKCPKKYIYLIYGESSRQKTVLVELPLEIVRSILLGPGRAGYVEAPDLASKPLLPTVQLLGHHHPRRKSRYHHTCSPQDSF
jgi:uncharacterized protein (TIGR00251 family)